MRVERRSIVLGIAAFLLVGAGIETAEATDEWKPYGPACTERGNVFEFTQKPSVRLVSKDTYEITFAVKGNCDATVGLVDEKGTVVRHIASGVLGSNAPAPFQKNSLKQTITWNGKDDLGEYVREPEKLQVRVSLGLNPTFDKRLGGTSPKNLPGYVWGIAIDSEGAYVFIKGPGCFGHVSVRRFDHDGNYVATMIPPPVNMPEEKLGGLTFIEYEKGTRAVHGVDLDQVARDNHFLLEINGKSIAECQPAVAGNRVFFLNAGPGLHTGLQPSKMFYVNTDGSLDVKGMLGRPFAWGKYGHLFPRLAASPDGKWIYMVGFSGAYKEHKALLARWSTDGKEKAQPFIGKFAKEYWGASGVPGTDNESLHQPNGVDCDAQGRIYVTDGNNNRLQIFSPEGKHLKTIPVERPLLVRVHQKTGAIYVTHQTRIRGKTAGRLTKFLSFDDPRKDFEQDGVVAAAFTLDSWTKRPRLWLAGEETWAHGGGVGSKGSSVCIWEEEGKKLRKIVDFDEEAKKEAGQNYLGRWNGNCFDKTFCDPTREQVYFNSDGGTCFQGNPVVFDLKTGNVLKQIRVPGLINDIAFCKRGYMHCHFNPAAYMPGVGRLDPGQSTPYTRYESTVPQGFVTLKEVPYDYGVELTHKALKGWTGALAVKDQRGAKFFQDGIGVNMRGDLAVESNIYYVPKMEEVGWEMGGAGIAGKKKHGIIVDANSAGKSYAVFKRLIQEKQKRGEEVYSMPRRPGISLAGATIWTFDATGESREKSPVIIGDLLAGVMIDEDGALYFTNRRTKAVGDKLFLAGKGGRFGDSEFRRNSFTGTYMKTGEDAAVLMKNSPIKMDQLPDRPADLIDTHGYYVDNTHDDPTWVEGAAWLYAGASPIVPSECSCPSMRAHLDWFKRSYVPEAYRHSYGVLDTAGNLILHIGSYGNFDSGSGPGSKVPVGGDGIGIFSPRFISGTDNYLCFADWAERLVVLKLNYHAEETAPIQLK